MHRRWLILGATAVAIVAVAAVVAVTVGRQTVPAPSASLAPGRPTSPPPSPAPTSESPSPPPIGSPAAPGPSSGPSATPSPSLVPAPLTGRPVSVALAQRPAIAVMVDDLAAARPQAGFSAASVIWQAPAEGGIPRYMLVFQETLPVLVGPVRSARQYFIDWAAELHALYVHVGGSPQALATLGAAGHGELVYDADEFRYGGGRYLWRVSDRRPPHNVYTDGEHLAALAHLLGVTAPPPPPGWSFAPDPPLPERPQGGRLAVAYPANTISYAYDRRTNRYVRSVSGETPQRDAATGEVVTPANVVVIWVHLAPLTGPGAGKGRLEATLVGSGPAWIAHNGRTIRGVWRKTAPAAPTRFFEAAGHPVTFTIGQTVIQVVPWGTPVVVRDGTPPRPPTRPAAGPAAL